MLAYRDHGIVCVRTNGSFTVDPSLVGVWTIEIANGRRSHPLPAADTPAWSRSGARLAYSRSGRIAHARPDGTDEVLVSRPGTAFWPTWSPEDSSLAWERPVDVPGVYEAKADGTGERLLVPFGATPDWHPTANRILCMAPTPGNPAQWALVEWDLGIDSMRVVRELPGWPRHPRYSPDGTRAVFAWRPADESTFRVWLVNLDGTGLAPLTTGPASQPAWSLDGRSVAFVRWDDHSNAPDIGVLWVRDVAADRESLLVTRWPARCP